MTIVLPQSYHAFDVLSQNRITCISQKDASRQDIRALKVGILNIMPRAETYEYSLLHPMGRSIMQIEPVWIKLKTHKYSSSDHDHLNRLYVTFEESIQNGNLDGLIITGAPVEEIPFEEVSYWDELTEILKFSRKHIPSTLALCWGGLAVAKTMGIEKEKYSKKLFGIYRCKNLDRSHPVTGDMDDFFDVPQSRHSGINDKILLEREQSGDIRLLASCEKGGYVIFESSDRKFLIHLGHSEYEPSRLIEEYKRDQKNGRRDVVLPENLSLRKPVNTWRSSRNEFFTQWIKYLYDNLNVKAET